jgi:hypothetical protein
VEGSRAVWARVKWGYNETSTRTRFSEGDTSLGESRHCSGIIVSRHVLGYVHDGDAPEFIVGDTHTALVMDELATTECNCVRTVEIFQFTKEGDARTSRSDSNPQRGNSCTPGVRQKDAFGSKYAG